LHHFDLIVDFLEEQAEHIANPRVPKNSRN
jgi:hypothetical protein